MTKEEQEAQDRRDFEQAHRILRKMDAYNMARKTNPPAFNVSAQDVVKLMLMDDMVIELKALKHELTCMEGRSSATCDILMQLTHAVQNMALRST